MKRHALGMTLIELVVTITIVAVAVTGVVGALTGTAVQSANRMIQHQATAIASAYLEEIMQRPVVDPDGGIEAARRDFDNVNDYNGLPDNVVRDQQGVAIPGLGNYQVTVQVGPGALPGIPAASVRLINVSVTHPTGIRVLMTGYKAT